ncbi:hypothetical protein F5B22DRAFT_593996 [Xylaria bambusicola]|uniref:uncharacterized protein n=1 Tax=Xylaria bambusicola TaxID=326684 RepID=UPI002007EADF|nr:uncharacterized protein F5B22DRAFT_593996 [Xylaria bambusicola]KAI0521767.1 hypothetical protein F5B22DRAFT_593996 [Xylaria bambusicola]
MFRACSGPVLWPSSTRTPHGLLNLLLMAISSNPAGPVRLSSSGHSFRLRVSDHQINGMVREHLVARPLGLERLTSLIALPHLFGDREQLLVQILLVDNRLTCSTIGEQLAPRVPVSQDPRVLPWFPAPRVNAKRARLAPGKKKPTQEGLDGIFSTAIGLIAECGSTHLGK